MDKRNDKGHEEDAEIAELMTELRDAEKKFRKYVEKRNELNDQARETRDERDALNDQKKQLVADMRALQEERDGYNAEARKHKEKRNEYQRTAKGLIEEKRRMRAASRETGKGNPAMGKIRDIEGELRRLERAQETTAMTVAKENEVIKRMAELKKELEAAQANFSEEAKMLGEIKDIDGKIDELFRMADEEHKQVVELSNKGQECHEKIGPILEQLRFLDAESDKKHEAYIALRKQADEQHAKATELREGVEKLRDRRTALFKERGRIVTDQKQSVKQNLFDEVKLEEKASDDMKKLLSDGKITL